MRYTPVFSLTFMSALLMSVAGGGCTAEAGAPKDESALGTAESELRACEASCQSTMIQCHNGCGANGPCHSSCDRNYESCLGSWQPTTLGHSICRIYNFNTTVFLQTIDTVAFRGCDGTIFTERGTSTQLRVIDSKSFSIFTAIFDRGAVESWVRSKMAQYGVGAGCPYVDIPGQ